MVTIRRMRGLTTEEYQGIQQAVKHFTFPVSVRTHRQQYAFGAIDLRPMKKAGYRFTPEQVDALIAFCRAYQLSGSSPQLFDSESRYAIYASGFNYLRRHIAPQPTQHANAPASP